MTNVVPIAFYLPQYHPIRINDVNWGDGFSDWTNVARAAPLFNGHSQPKLPGLLGFYDLRAPEVMIEQTQLARAHGIGAFCFYYYRFGDLRVMQRPLDMYLADRRPELPFLWCWANESWTKAWDGRSEEVLLTQTYDEAAFQGLVADLTRAILDERYFRMSDRPVFLIYQAELVPEGPTFVARLREAIRTALGEDLTVGAVYSTGFRQTTLDWLDFVVQFPPHRLPRKTPRVLMTAAEVVPHVPDRGDHFERYQEVVQAALNGADLFQPCFLGVTPDWDNSPRRPKGAHILVGSTPEEFQKWVTEAAQRTAEFFAAGTLPAPLLFVNAWNEWAEGAMLEPSLHHGTAYLEALTAGLRAAAQPTDALSSQ